MFRLRLQDLPNELKNAINEYVFGKYCGKKSQNNILNFFSALEAGQYRGMYAGARRVWCNSNNFWLQVDQRGYRHKGLERLEEKFLKDVKRLCFLLP